MFHGELANPRVPYRCRCRPIDGGISARRDAWGLELVANDKARRLRFEQYVEQGYRDIARQLEIIEALRLHGYPTDGAERRLARVKHALQINKARLAQLPEAD